MANSKKTNSNLDLDISADSILEFVRFNTGVKRFDIHTKEWYFDNRMTKSQKIINIAVIIQFFTGLRMNEIVKMSFSQLLELSKKKKVRIELSKTKNRKTRNIELKAKDFKANKLHRELVNLLKDWLKFKQDFLVVSKNMNPKPKTIKKANGKTYQTYYFVYINNFIAKVNAKLKLFVAKKESENKAFLPNHIEKLTTHGFRNNFIVSVYKYTGNDIVATKLLIGHSDISITDGYISKYKANEIINPY